MRSKVDFVQATSYLLKLQIDHVILDGLNAKMLSDNQIAGFLSFIMSQKLLELQS